MKNETLETLEADAVFVEKVIMGCTTAEQLESASKLVDNYKQKYNSISDVKWINKLLSFIEDMEYNISIRQLAILCD